LELTVTVHNPHGLHARPAAAFVQATARYRATVQIQNLTSSRGPVSARSILAVMGLGIRQGDAVMLRAEGEDAEQALSALRHLLEIDEDAGGPTR
jgi:phosphotransferase system HPr (HPr) family protein